MKTFHLEGNTNILTVSDARQTVKLPLISFSKDMLSPKTVSGVSESVYHVLNRYTQSFPVSKITPLVKLYSEFAELENTLTGVPNDPEVYKKYMHDVLSVEVFSQERMLAWVKDKVTLPASTPIVDEIDNVNHTVSGTYTGNEYYDLVVLTMMMKLVLPYLSVYMSKLDKNDGKRKELKTLHIIPTILSNSPGYVRLFKYIEGYVVPKAPEATPDQLLKHGIDSESKLSWIFSQLVIKKISTYKVFNNNDNKHMITLLFAHLSNFTRQQSGLTIYRDKKPNSSSNSDDESSCYDAYRTKEKYPLDDQKIMHISGGEEYILNFYEGKYDVQEYERIKHAMQTSINFNITQIHILIMRWIFANEIPIQSYMFFDRMNMKALMALAHCLLCDKYPYIALMMVSTLQLDGDGNPIPYGFATRRRLQPDLVRELRDIYGLTITSKDVTVITDVIEKTSSNMIKNWVVVPNFNKNDHYEMMQLQEESDGLMKIIIQNDTKHMLYNLITDLNK